ncbi:MAG: VanZ family protein [Pseudomonadota bacterium]
MADRLLRLVPILLYCAGIFLLSGLPHIPDAVSWMPDKIGHFIVYAGLGFLVAQEIRLRGLQSSRWIWAGSALFCLLYGISDELHQSFVPGRTAQIGDVAADTAGGLTAGVMYVLWGAGKQVTREK